MTSPWYRRDAESPSSNCASTAIGAWSALPRVGIFQATATAGTCASASVWLSRFSAVFRPSDGSVPFGTGRAGDPPKYFSTSANAASALMSPTMPITALFGP